MMKSQELETVIRLKLNFVILDDGAHGMVRWKQAVNSFPDYGLTFGTPDFVRYAESYGAEGTRVTSTEGLIPVIENAFRGGGASAEPKTINRRYLPQGAPYAIEPAD